MQFIDTFDFKNQVSLYVHVPFCKSKCSYCAFYSKSCNSKKIDKYFERISAEIDDVVKRMEKPFYTAYIGGGNPGCLSVEQIEILCRKICKNGRPEEFTIEMNPESLTEEHFYLFERYLTRLSMGVQSLNSQALEFLGRNASVENTVKGINLALCLREKTNAEISFDLISCLPSWHDYMGDVTEVVEKYKPDHISVYALSLEEGTPLFERNPKLPSADEQYCILSDIWNYLDSTGYVQYEVSNFALPGKYSKHNSVYWDYEQYIGLGPSAASTAFRGHRVFRGELAGDLDVFVSGEPFSGYQVSELSERESLEEFVLMGLRHSKGLDLTRLKDFYGIEVKSVPDGFFVKNGYLCPDKNGLMVADWAASFIIDGCIDS